MLSNRLIFHLKHKLLNNLAYQQLQLLASNSYNSIFVKKTVHESMSSQKHRDLTSTSPPTHTNTYVTYK